MVVVADSNTLIGLAKVEVLFLLPMLFGEVHITPSVYHEVVVEGAGRPGADEVREATWLSVTAPGIPANPTLQAIPTSTDRDVLALAHQLPADWLITDDRVLVRNAGVLGVATLHTVDVVRLGKMAGHVPSCRDIMDRMLANGFGILYMAVLFAAGEL